VIIANVAASWLEVLNTYARYIAYGGASLLILVGLTTLLKKNAPASDSKAIKTVTGAHYFRIWLSGFLINSINPGVIISWLAAVTATLNQSGGYRFILFGTCLSLILVVDFFKVFLAEKIRGLLTPARVVKVQRITGFILMILGVFLLLKTILE
jgi:threonine/homoserine/homoserine lactone efflux protein